MIKERFKCSINNSRPPVVMEGDRFYKLQNLSSLFVLCKLLTNWLTLSWPFLVSIIRVLVVEILLLFTGGGVYLLHKIINILFFNFKWITSHYKEQIAIHFLTQFQPPFQELLGSCLERFETLYIGEICLTLYVLLSCSL